MNKIKDTQEAIVRVKAELLKDPDLPSLKMTLLALQARLQALQDAEELITKYLSYD